MSYWTWHLAKCEENSNLILKKTNKRLCLLLGLFIYSFYKHAFIAITNVGVDIGQRGAPTCLVGFNGKHLCQGCRFAFITICTNTRRVSIKSFQSKFCNFLHLDSWGNERKLVFFHTRLCKPNINFVSPVVAVNGIPTNNSARNEIEIAN